MQHEMRRPGVRMVTRGKRRRYHSSMVRGAIGVHLYHCGVRPRWCTAFQFSSRHLPTPRNHSLLIVTWANELRSGYAHYVFILEVSIVHMFARCVEQLYSNETIVVCVQNHHHRVSYSL